MREGMLFGMWVPWQGTFVGVAAFLGLAQLEMASHVSDGNVELVADVFAFLAALGSAGVLVNSAVALFGLRAKVRRARLRQAEAD
jgi:hypothetical protein